MDGSKVEPGLVNTLQYEAVEDCWGPSTRPYTLLLDQELTGTNKYIRAELYSLES